jgi:hypothetical protein
MQMRSRDFTYHKQIPLGIFGAESHVRVIHWGDVQVEWVKDAHGEWCALDEVPLRYVFDRGVYIIWRRGVPPGPSVVVRVGRGAIAVRLAVDRMDPNILRAGRNLLTTWAVVEDSYAAAVEAYLNQQLRPLLVGQRISSPLSVAVNLPAIA